MINKQIDSGSKVYVIVLNWNGAVDTVACLESIQLLNGNLPKIIVCDNASTDDSWSRLQAYVTAQSNLDIQLVQTGSNLGFSGGNNVGLKIALSDPEMQYAWLLNNDTEVAPRALVSLTQYMDEHPSVGICGSTLLYMHDQTLIQAVGGQYNFWLGTSSHVLGHQKYSEALCRSIDPATLDYVVGASMFVRRSVFETIGLLSEDYFLYSEEIDWAIRLKRQMPSFVLGYAADSIVYHKEGASTGANDQQGKTYSYFADYYFITSRLKFSRKFFPIRRWFVQASMFAVAINRIRRKQWRSFAVALCALIGFMPKALDPRTCPGGAP